MKFPSSTGADALFTYGSDGAITGRICGDTVGIRFEGPMGCTLMLDFGEVLKIEYEAVFSDLISGKVYCPGKEISFDIIATNPQGVYIGADSIINIKLLFRDNPICEKSENTSTYILNGETAALCINKTGLFSAGFAMGYGCTEKASDISHIDINKKKDAISKRYAGIKLPKGIDGIHEQVYRKCLCLVESAVCTDSDNQVFSGRTEYGLSINSRQAMLMAVGLKKTLPDIALSTVVYLTNFINEKGILPVNINSGFGDSGCCAPLLPWAFYEVVGDCKEKIEKHYEALRRHVMYFINERDMNKNNLYHWLAGSGNNPCHDSGMIHSPRFDNNVIVDAPDIGAYLYMSVDAMFRMSKVINENSDILYWNVIAERIRLGINDFLYDEADKFYYDRGVIGKRLNKLKAISGFMPVFAGICPPIKLNALMNQLSDKATFGARYGVPSLARNEKSFECDTYRGSVYFEENYKLVYGLHKAGKLEKAAEIVSRCLEAACRGYETSGVIYEYYSPVSVSDTAYQKRCGMGGGSMGIYGYNTCRRDCPVSAGFLIAMIELLSSEC